jgi:hypothetical protein
MSEVTICPLPQGSRALPASAAADFSHRYRMTNARPEASAFENDLDWVLRTPASMSLLMELRKRALRWVGLNDLGTLAPAELAKAGAAYRPGQRIGIFTLQYADERERILEDRDKHLPVQVSLFKSNKNELQMSAVAPIHNRLGRACMSVVGPVHGASVPLMLRRSGNVQ